MPVLYLRTGKTDNLPETTEVFILINLKKKSLLGTTAVF